MLQTTPLYAGLLALLFVVLSARVIVQRGVTRTSHGDGDDEVLLRRIRVHANFVEYVPLALLLLAMAELQGMPVWLVHLFGAMLFLGRTLHAWGFGAEPQVFKARKWGMILTFLVILITAIANIGHAVF
ncbi:MAPEG family protein [Tropicimonas sp. TH_r6]|uniref:MAPEG family protein n=1 Tax=Tropicimonas sp. TH_r6 TaxID=3082085 RepID=UPI0029539CED|nr:MAPEG family protein [Tropicimonas sp. TH_r6]MDV7144996.1 MAPEG family protein [Tropicimonas sp. TH_r6]